MICGEPGQSLVESVPRSCTGRLYIPKVNNSTVQSLVESVPRSCTVRLYISKANNNTVQYRTVLYSTVLYSTDEGKRSLIFVHAVTYKHEAEI